MRHGMHGAWTVRGGAAALPLSCAPVSAAPETIRTGYYSDAPGEEAFLPPRAGERAG